MDNKIYFLGGITENYFGTNDFFYLDVSIPFNLDSTLPIVDLNTIFLIFGISEESFSYSFVINDQEWDPRTLEANVRWSSVVCNKNGSYIYTYGRVNYNHNYMMTIIDSTTRWDSVSSDLNIPNSLVTAILLLDGRIAYIGDRTKNDLVNFRNIHIYDTNDGTWINMVNNFSASGIEPSPRYSHTAVLTQDGLIIIYGGMNNNSPVPDKISVLDTKVDPFIWSIPNIDPAPSSAPSSGHTATLVGNYMIIAFGYTTYNIDPSDQIHMIDVSEENNYKWVKSFTPNNTYTIESASTTESASATKSANATKSPGAAHTTIIVGTTGGIATVIIIISVSYLLYCRKRTVIYAPQAKHAVNC
ncbi:unnamed protein product [Rhizophagus irregularis]|nr:unnamed protein product [Rhizophagus irregularis]